MLTRRFVLLVSILLLVAGMVRIGWMAGHQPLLGYANQFDMGRTSACFGMWPDLPEPGRYEAHLRAPVARYVEGEHRPDECYASSELLFAGIGMAAWKLAADAGLAPPAAMDLRHVGGVKALGLVLLALVFTLMLRQRPAWMLAHAAVFALVLADPVVTLWLNTLYTEFAAVFFAYAAVMCLVVIAGITPERGGWYVAFGLALLGLGLSRQQHALLPACLLLLAWPVIRQHHRRFTWPLAAVAVAVLVLQLAVIARPPSIGAANNANVVLGTLLPASTDPNKSLAKLGLPAGCDAVIGATWYVTMGEDLDARCPGALTVSRLRIAGLLAAEPMIAVRALMKAAPLSQALLLRHLGIDASKAYGTIEEQGLPFGISVGAIVERLPLSVYLGALLALLAAFAVSLVAWAATTLRDGSPSMASLLGSALGGIAVYAMLTSVFGDGLVEIPRHAHLGGLALLTLAILGVALAATRMRPRLPGGVRPSPHARVEGTFWFGWGLLGAIAVVSVSSPLWLAAWKQQPLAIGAMDEPRSNLLNAPVVRLRGWAMEPFGPVRAVMVINGTIRLEARPWAHPADPVGAVLGRIFPTYRDPSRARFETVIDTAPYGDRPVSVRTYAQTRDGILTEIDRRILRRPAP